MPKTHANELSVNVTNSWPLVSLHLTRTNSDPDSYPAYFSLTRHLNPNTNLFLAHNDNFQHYNRSLEWTSGEFEPTESCHRPKNQVIDTSGVGTPPPPTNNNNGGGQAAMLSHMFGAPDPIFPSNNHECCSNSGETSPYQMYLPHVKKCCDSGSTTLIDNEC